MSSAKLATLVAALVLSQLPARADSSQIMKTMETELQRSFAKLKNAGAAPLYFLAYRLYDEDEQKISGHYGALNSGLRSSHSRYLKVEVRVGSPESDNTHKIRGKYFYENYASLSAIPVTQENDEAALRYCLWLKTDDAFKKAQEKYRQVKVNKAVKAEDEDAADDFSHESSRIYEEPGSTFKVDASGWLDRVKRLSAIYKNFPNIQDSDVTLTAEKTRRYIVSSEGTKIEDERVQYRFVTTAESKAEDGMKLWLYDGLELPSVVEMPGEQKLESMVTRVAESVEALRKAPKVEPYAGPAILRGRAAAVFFHETFGHRIEGHRQKDEDEGRTFTRKLGQLVMPSFITVIDDPCRQKIGNTSLNGYYKFDDEGIPAQKVVLVDHGILKSFLMSRSPVKGFPNSNGHGRCSPFYYEPAARQGNLIVESSKVVPYATLRQMLIDEAKKQGKPYGLIFDEIAGGFTFTSALALQAYKLMPLRVLKVFTDGRPDELLRGANIIGTPLQSLEQIIAAGDDVETFNGTCGAESGDVPVSASSPSLLLKTIEVERQEKDYDKPPLLPAPLFDDQTKNKHPRSEGAARNTGGKRERDAGNSSSDRRERKESAGRSTDTNNSGKDAHKDSGKSGTRAGDGHRNGRQDKKGKLDQ